MAVRRLMPDAARALREAVREAGGVEVFAIGDVGDGAVTGVTITCRGQRDRVNALIDRPNKGQVVIHNHPSGDLTPSDADMALAGRYGDDGVGFVIIDNKAERLNVVIEPAERGPVYVGADEVERFFRQVLPQTMPGWEPRGAQVEMACKAIEAFDAGKPLVVEAGTGTGKSLAYLVPAALWALANESRVVIATHTRALQAQVMRSDLPILQAAGVAVRASLLEGRSNYICRRRLQSAFDEEDNDAVRAEIEALRDWSATSFSASRSDLPFRIAPELWERVESDSDLTLRHRCEHYQEQRCHYYNARQAAAGAHIIVANHALLMVDLTLKAEGSAGLLPKFDRLVIDEAQHLEEVATGALSSKVTALAVRRAIFPLLPRSRGRSKGALGAVATSCEAAGVPRDVCGRIASAASDAHGALDGLLPQIELNLVTLAGHLAPEQPQRRVDAQLAGSAEWQMELRPRVEHTAGLLEKGAGYLDAIKGALGEHTLAPAHAQPMLDVDRARRRLVEQAASLRTFLTDDPDRCRWLELARDRNDQPRAAVCTAPVDVAAALQSVLWNAVPGAVSTSATLSVAGDFAFWRQRHGMGASEQAVFPSPFDHFKMAILGVPNDVAPPDDPEYERYSARAVVDAIKASGGGAFVLCTSFRAVQLYAAACRAALPPEIPVLAHGELSRPMLLERFREHRNAVLVGADSFWEGVSVKGDGLRLVIVPRLPFRVPTEPLQQARHERIVRNGGDAFRTLSLPQAVLRMRQGYGRLIRSTEDRGVVLILDRRVLDKSYGRIVLAALPPARRIVAPMRRILDEMQRFYAERTEPEA